MSDLHNQYSVTFRHEPGGPLFGLYLLADGHDHAVTLAESFTRPDEGFELVEVVHTPGWRGEWPANALP